MAPQQQAKPPTHGPVTVKVKWIKITERVISGANDKRVFFMGLDANNQSQFGWFPINVGYTTALATSMASPDGAPVTVTYDADGNNVIRFGYGDVYQKGLFAEPIDGSGPDPHSAASGIH